MLLKENRASSRFANCIESSEAVVASPRNRTQLAESKSVIWHIIRTKRERKIDSDASEVLSSLPFSFAS